MEDRNTEEDTLRELRVMDAEDSLQRTKLLKDIK